MRVFAKFAKFSSSVSSVRLVPGHKEIRQRALALFFVMVMLVSLLMPSAEVYAQAAAANEPNPNTPMKRDYPGADKPTQSDLPAAVDAPAIQSGLAGQVHKYTAPAGEVLNGKLPDPPKPKKHELTEERTATSSTTVNEDGTVTKKHFVVPQFYKKDGKWQAIGTTLIEDKNPDDNSNPLARALDQVESWLQPTKNLIAENNDWQARFSPSNGGKGMVRIKQGTDQVGFSPVGAKDVDPVITTTDDGRQVVHYYDLWPGVNVDYTVENASVKENIIIKDKDATNSVSFRLLGNATIAKQSNGERQAPSYRIKGQLGDQFEIAPANLMLNNFGFESKQDVFSQTYENGLLTVQVDKEYLAGLPAKAFPAVVDPGFNSSFGSRSSGDYMSFKTDGTICYSNVCNLYAGSLYDNYGNLQYWRGAYKAPYDQFKPGTGNSLISANLHLQQRSNESFWTGTWDAHNFQVGHATCLNGFNCVDGVWASATFGGAGDINVTNLYQSMINAGDFGAFMMVMGEDNTSSSYKNFDPNNSYVAFTYGGAPPAPSVANPVANQVYVDPQASFSWNLVQNPNGNTPLKYEAIVSSAPGASGSLISSGLLDSLQWTIPDGILQDGSTYYVQVRTFDPLTNAFSASFSTSVPFRIDLRTGKDATQTYDSLGPVSVDLATGNVATSAASHSSAALGGSLGVSLDYNSPLKSRNGLVGEYWNNLQYSGNPVTTRVDQKVDFDWNTGSPASGVNADGFAARWSGWFVAPKTGTYQFGGTNDDGLSIWVNGQVMYSNTSGCWTGICYTGQTIALNAGQVVSFKAEYNEVSGPAYSRIYVKGPVSERMLPTDWLQTGVRSASRQKGLNGTYYGKFDGTNTFSTGNAQLMKRVDPYLSFDWGTGSPMPNGPDGFLVRWSGYVTVPAAGAYTFGVLSDDGAKITLNGSTTVYNEWVNRGATEAYGTAYNFTTGNLTTKIDIEYYDNGGPAAFQLKVQGAGLSAQVVPVNWLSPSAQVLPDGWTLGIDPDGNVGYDRIKVNQNSAVLSDSSGATHEYTWTGGGYKPPVNEDGFLVRNADGTHTLQDVDGRTYVFDTDGTLKSLTSPTDDRKPVALKYSYNSINGGPPAITQITDGVDANRWAKVYYYQDGTNNCVTPPTGLGYDIITSDTIKGMICAVKTDDGRVTSFFYIGGLLARIAEPGDENTDYLYETVSNANGEVGKRLVAIRDVAANDAVAAGIRTNDATIRTELSYDILGRVTGVTQPAATTGASRIQHTVEYLPGVEGYTDSNGTVIPGYTGITRQHIAGATEPNGFIRQVKYDNLLRTVEDTDIANLTDKTSWDNFKDLVLSTTDETGLMSTTIYDDEDRPTDSYGPAPSAWFGSDRKPLTANVNQVPHNQTGYDEGITGTSVAWYDYTRQFGNSAGALTGAPRLHTTGLTPATPGVMSGDLTLPPIAPDLTKSGYGFSASGKLRLPNGTYQMYADTSEGVRVWVNDELIVDGWQDAAYRQVPGIKSFTVANNEVKRVRVDAYRKHGSTGAFNVWMKQDFGFDFTNNWTSWLKPGYGLSTSSKVFDSTIGDVTTTTNYGANPELGLAQSATVDPTGLNLTANLGYEPVGSTNGFLRQTSKTLPGNTSSNPSFTYTHYGATDTADNPCTVGTTESYRQGGFMKLKTEASPGSTTTTTGGTGAAPVVRSSTSGTISSGALSLAKPTGTTTGDLLVMTASADLDAAENVTYTIPTGWTQVLANTRSDTSSAGNNLQVWYKVATASEPTSYSITPDHNNLIGGSIMRLDGQATTSPINAQNVTASLTGEAAAPSVTTTTANTQVLRIATWDQSKTVVTGPTGVTQSYYVDVSGHDNWGGYKEQATAGSVGVAQWDLSGAAPFVGFTLAIAPSATGTTTTTPTPGRATETIYDAAGRVVASRFNSDPWTCLTYDVRGRASQSVVPTINGRAGRTVSTNYAYLGSPLKVRIDDSVSGAVEQEVDLLGRSVGGKDQFGNVSAVTYDSIGRVTSHTSPIGTETYTYDTYNRITSYLVGGVTYATVTYDAFSRVKDVTYNQAAAASGGSSGAAPIVQSSNSGTASSGSLTLNKPTGTTTGDLLVMTASADLDVAENVTYTIPTGWTQALANTRSDASSAGNNLQVWYKVATASESTSYSITPDHNNLIAGSISRITGQDATTPIDVQAVTASLTGEASAPTVTTTAANDTVLRIATWDQSKTLSVAPTGVTNSYYVDVSGHDNWGGYQTQATAGATGVAQWDLSGGAPYVGFTLAIKPATSGGSSTGTPLKLEQIKLDSLKRSAGAVFRFSDGTAFDESVSRTQSGGVTAVTGAFNGTSVTNSFTYDKVGRLLEATVDKTKHTYGYGAPSSSTCNQTPANLSAHKSGNRTSYTRTNTVTSQVLTSTSYCYDQSDRVLASSDSQIGTPTYDDHGNTATLAGNGTPVNLTYDAIDNNTAIVQGTNRVEYTKTASGAVLRKKEYSNGALTKSYRYVSGGAILQSCSLSDDNSCTTTDTYLSLPGGVTLTLSPTNPDTAKRTVYSIKNFHGDTAMTASATGAPSSSVYLYEPYGQQNSSPTFNTNSDPANATNAPMGWAASPTRKTESSFSLAVMQMGARVYLPSLGRFVQADPMSGGNVNGYAYAVDPVNYSDLSGMFLQGGEGANFLQPVAYTAVHLQPSVGLQTVQTVRNVRLTTANAPVPSPPPTRRDFTPAPLARVNASGYLTSAAKSWQSSNYVPGGVFIGHFTVSGGMTLGPPGYTIGVGGQFKFNADGWRFAPYGGYSKPKGFDASVTFSGTALPDHGSCSGQVNYFAPNLVGGGIDQSGAVEAGLGTPGSSVTYACVK